MDDLLETIKGHTYFQLHTENSSGQCNLVICTSSWICQSAYGCSGQLLYAFGWFHYSESETL